VANKRVINLIKNKNRHWVGDGFPVSTFFSYAEDNARISPFLLLDYAGPEYFPPASTPRGVGKHPHRGFETVTIVYQGEVQHKDSAGNSGKIVPGDVQWMTAARGIVHEEMHSTEFTQAGGTLEMVQLWVNLPAKYKMNPPGYQEITSSKIPVISLCESGSLRLIAGEYQANTGAAQTFTPINLWDIQLSAGTITNLALPDGHNTMLLCRVGKVEINQQDLQQAELVQLDAQGDSISLHAKENCHLLLISGEPIQEPVFGHGPFVMNTEDEIRTAIEDYSAGRF